MCSKEIRISECIDLPLDCLRQVGTDEWAFHVPLGKLHTERLVPADYFSKSIARESGHCTSYLETGGGWYRERDGDLTPAIDSATILAARR